MRSAVERTGEADISRDPARALPSELGLCLVAVFLAVGALATFEVSDPDLGFHLATGRAILAQGHLLDRNVLSFAEPDRPWVLQQGPPAVLFELLWRWGGVTALILSKACVIATTFVVVFLAAARLGARPRVAAVVVIVAAWSCAFRFVERPLIFSSLALALVLWSLASAGDTLGGRRALWLGVATLAVAAACHLHAGAIFSFILLVIVVLALTIEPLRRHFPFLGAPHAPAGPGAALAVLGVALVAAGIAASTLALYHPFPLRVLEAPFVMGRDRFLAEHLIEFRPPWRFPFQLLHGYWALLALTLLALVLAARRLPLALCAVVLVFLGLSLRFVRFVDLFAIVAAPVLSLAIARLPIRLTARPWVGWLALSAAVLAAPISHWSRFPLRLAFAEGTWPTELFAFVSAEALRGPAFVSDGWAGPYLAFFYPRERVYFFPAFDAFSVGLYREYLDIRYGHPGWDAKLDHHGIELCILKYTSANERRYQAGGDNLRQRLARDPRWALVDFDDRGEIFVRLDGVNRQVAERLGIAGVDPDRRSMPRGTGDTQARLRQLAAYRKRLGLSRSDRLDNFIEPEAL